MIRVLLLLNQYTEYGGFILGFPAATVLTYGRPQVSTHLNLPTRLPRLPMPHQITGKEASSGKYLLIRVVSIFFSIIPI